MISIVIPAYNDEKYIVRCLESIEKQTYKDYEVLLVLDGSTDKTKEFASNYVGRVNNLHIIEQENTGSGRARNNGLEHSNGEYIVFVDADDWLEPEALKILMEIEDETNADYIVANAIVVEKKDDAEENKRYVGHAEDSFVEGSTEVSKKYFDLDVDASSHSPWGKLFKASIIRENNVRFPDLRRSQDIVFNNTYARYINSIYVSKQYIYNFWNTIYTSKVYKDSKNRRNSPRFIEAEKNHLGTMSRVVGSFYETMEIRGYYLTEEDYQKRNDSYLVGIYNNIAANAKRNIKNAKYALKTYNTDNYYQKAIATPQKVMLVYRIMAFLLRKRCYLAAAYYVLICEELNDILKKFSR